MRVGNYFSSVELSWSTFIARQGVSSLVSVLACFDAIRIMIIIWRDYSAYWRGYWEEICIQWSGLFKRCIWILVVCEWLNIYSVAIALYLWLIVESLCWFTLWQCRSVVRPFVCRLWSVSYLHTWSSGGIKLSWKLLLIELLTVVRNFQSILLMNEVIINH